MVQSKGACRSRNAVAVHMLRSYTRHAGTAHAFYPFHDQYFPQIMQDAFAYITRIIVTARNLWPPFTLQNPQLRLECEYFLVRRRTSYIPG